MINIQTVGEDIVWVGANDRHISRFENFIPLTAGVSYNSYLLKDEKTILFDTADARVSGQFLENLNAALEGRKLDGLVILHMEPDHCALISEVASAHPGIRLYGSGAALTYLNQFFPGLASFPREVIKEGSILETGRHHIRFTAAPMVHWPEVMMAYDDVNKALFSADAFGMFGAVEGSIFADEHDFENEFHDEARRYYANIVGKYGPQVQAVLKKAGALDIERIYPLHGPVWRKDLNVILDLYQKWSTYTPETDDIAVIYGTLYGHTADAAVRAADLLKQETGKNVIVCDASETDVTHLIDAVWKCGKIVIFCPTYNAGIYPPVENFLNDMTALNVQKRVFALAENGTWAPAAAKPMRAKLEQLKNCTILDKVLTFKSVLHDDDALAQFVKAVAEA